MEFFDSHAHYDDERFEADRASIIEEVYNSGITKLANIGSSMESSKKAIEIAEKYSYMYCSVRNIS
jgi:TatD DNase family protein